VEVAQAPDAEALVEAADQHYAALAFRAIDVRDAAVGAALAPPLLARGYRAHPDLLMLLHATPPAPDPAIAIAEVERAALASSRAAASQVGSQLVSRDALIAVAVDQRCFAVLDGAEVVARCVLYAADGVAQVENVYTAPSHRGRGLARALVVGARPAAGPGGGAPATAGAEVVFLVTHADDTPRQLYRRLGFVDAGLLPRFRRAVCEAQ
jgi:ribosomal protein S18 acetylase RimI-like enzyme